MEKLKVITICGSLKFQREIMKITEEMELKGNCMLSIIYETRGDRDCYSTEDFEVFERSHMQRIQMSDAILVANINGYIGQGARLEIEYAKQLKKEIMYTVPVE